MRILRVIAFVCLLALPVFSQTTVAPLVNPHVQLLNELLPCSGCQLFTYVAGTTTPLATYTDSTGSTANPNPLILDATGGGSVWLATSSAYKLVLQNAVGAQLWSEDNVQGGFTLTLGDNRYAMLNGANQPFTGTVIAPDTELQGPWADWRNPNVGPAAVGSADQTTTAQAALNYTASNSGTPTFRQGLMPLGSFPISSTLSAPTGTGGWGLQGLGGMGQLGCGSTIKWNGLAGGTILSLDRTRDTKIGGVCVDLNNLATTGIVISQLTATTGGISSHNSYYDLQAVHIPANGNGMVIIPAGDSQANNEGHKMWGFSAASDSPYTSGSIGLKIDGSPNMRNFGVYEIETLNTGTGLFVGPKTVHVLGGLTEAHTTAVTINTPGVGNNTFVGFLHDEDSKAQVNFLSGGSDGLVTYFGNTAEISANDPTRYAIDLTNFGGLFVAEGNNFDQNLFSKPVQVGGQSFLDIGNRWPGAIDYVNGGGNGNGFGGGNFLVGSLYNAYTAGFGAWQPTHNDASDTWYANGMWIGFSVPGGWSGQAGNSFSSPGFVLASGIGHNATAPDLYPWRIRNHILGANHIVIEQMPVFDPIANTTRSSTVVDYDFQTNANGGTFKTAHQQVADLKIASSPTITGISGNASSILTAGTISGAGPICADGSGNGTTAGCSTGLPVFAAQQFLSQTAAIGTQTLNQNLGAPHYYRISVNITCRTAVSTATVSATISYTDSSGTAQTITTPTATCTTLGAASVASLVTTISTQTHSFATINTTLANGPTYDISFTSEQMN